MANAESISQMSYPTYGDFEAVIGLEVHCQLATKTKIFCGCATKSHDGQSVAEVAVNLNTCPICAGHPGTLPVLNKKVVEFAIMAGLATESTINLKNIFSRKNYFYPDLPKGYQITQFDLPICENGSLEIEVTAGKKRVHIQRIHMEEDAGKNVHMSGFSLVNLNRAGVPLIEIVSGPDMKCPEEAGAYLRSLHAIVTYLGVCDGNMQEGNFRCDANVSVMKKGSKQFGTRAEIKNVNSFRFVEKAIEYEIHRQIERIQSGGKIIQETRLYDSQKNVTQSMRSKEEAQDYRYFPEPDLISIQIAPLEVERIRKLLPELPSQKRQRFESEFGLSSYDAGVLTSSQSLAQFFEGTIAILQKKSIDLKGAAKQASNWLSGEISRLLNEQNIEIAESKLSVQNVADVVELTLAQVISSTGAKQVVSKIWTEGGSVLTWVEQLGLKQVSDISALEPVIDQVLKANPGQVAEYRSGKEKLLGFFVGQVMKASGGKANPAMLQDLVKKKLAP